PTSMKQPSCLHGGSEVSIRMLRRGHAAGHGPTSAWLTGYARTSRPIRFATYPAIESTPRAPPCTTIVPCGSSRITSTIGRGSFHTRGPQISTFMGPDTPPGVVDFDAGTRGNMVSDGVRR